MRKCWSKVTRSGRGGGESSGEGRGPAAARGEREGRAAGAKRAAGATKFRAAALAPSPGDWSPACCRVLTQPAPRGRRPAADWASVPCFPLETRQHGASRPEEAQALPQQQHPRGPNEEGGEAALSGGTGQAQVSCGKPASNVAAAVSPTWATQRILPSKPIRPPPTVRPTSPLCHAGQALASRTAGLPRGQGPWPRRHSSQSNGVPIAAIRTAAARGVRRARRRAAGVRRQFALVRLRYNGDAPRH
jgi:hypothetical protein